MKQFSLILLGLIALAGLQGCSSDEPKIKTDDSDQRIDIPISRSEHDALAKQNEFGFRMLGRLEESRMMLNDNIVFSPLSASMDLSMIAAGATPEVADAIYATLGYNGASVADVNSANKTILSHLPGLDSKSTVRIANSLWIDHRVNLLSQYTDMCGDIYSADLYRDNLSSSEAMKKMNAWAAEKTEGVINSLLRQPLDGTLDISFFNALYFKGEWASPFKAELTDKSRFSNRDGSEKTVDMMHGEKKLKCWRDDTEQALKMIYGNGAYSITLVLPNEGVSVEESLATFSASKIAEWLEISKATGANYTKNVDISLPRFSVKYEGKMVEALASMGMPRIESIRTWPGISADKVCLGNLIQHAAISVDEKGTTAAAVSYTDTYLADADFDVERVTMTFDRPFFYWISEVSTDAILFMGIVNSL